MTEDPTCTDCGGTGESYQTERRCACKPAINGWSIECSLCGGAGYRTVWSFGVKEPDECRDCGGSGSNWRYAGGAIARYYSGPLIGRSALAQARKGTKP